jgi:orotidine-5'-phosphate decarboxylase
VINMKNVTDRLTEAIKEKESLVCVGLDPRIGQIPEHIKKRALREWDDTPEAVASAIVDFNTLIIDHTMDVAAAYKPQIAFYEQYGSAGVRAFKRTVDYAKGQGAVVVEDGKRNDIGSTAEAYADGHIGEVELIGDLHFSNFDVDMITVNPYLGIDGVEPFLEYGGENGKGVFILCRTSNDSATDLQDRLVDLNPDEIEFMRSRLEGSGLSLMDLPVMKEKGKPGKAPNYAIMAKLIDEWGKDLVGECDYSSAGAVVGATYPEEAKVLRRLMPNTWFLVPGYGAQGGKGEDIPNFVDGNGLGAIVNSARGIMLAYTKEPYSNIYKPEQFADASREAAIATRDDITGALKKADKWF